MQTGTSYMNRHNQVAGIVVRKICAEAGGRTIKVGGSTNGGGYDRANMLGD